MTFSKSFAVVCLVLAGSAVAAEPVGKLAAVRGEVTLDGKAARSGQPIFETSKIKTANGKANILLGGMSVIQLGFDTELDVKSALIAKNKPVEAELDLEQGRVRALVRSSGQPKKLTIRARSMVMGVRGTEVVVDNPADPNVAPTFTTVEGLAEVSSTSSPGKSAPIALPANHFSSGTGEAKPLAASEARALASEVALQRGEALTVAEVQSAASKPAETPASAPAGTFQNLEPKLDPLANSQILNSTVKITPTSQAL